MLQLETESLYQVPLHGSKGSGERMGFRNRMLYNGHTQSMDILVTLWKGLEVRSIERSALAYVWAR